MNKKNYVILDIGKIIIDLESKPVKYYKETNNELIPLSESEIKYVESFLAKKDGVYNSEKLDNIIKENASISNRYTFCIPLLTYIERVIPQGYHTNFYKNLKTLSVSKKAIPINNDASNKENPLIINSKYNLLENELIINSEYIDKLLEISELSNNPRAFFDKEFNCTILHELLHMASTNYDKETKTLLCGFDNYSSSENIDRNNGLTEGFTEVVASGGVSEAIETSSNYYIEALFVNQLIQIIGYDVVAKSYFGNLGIHKMLEKLNEMKIEHKANYIFTLIQYNYCIRNESKQQTVLGNIQSSLISYYKIKLEKDIMDGVSKDQIEQSLSIFSSMLVTPAILEAKMKNPKNYIGLKQSITEFEELRAYIEEKINSKTRT